MRYVTSVLALSLLVGVANAQIVRQLQSTNPDFRAAGKQGCISTSENANGAPVIIHDCNNEDVSKHSWAVSPWIVGPQSFPSIPSLMKIFGDKCLDVKDGMNADGTKLQLWTCDPGNTNQLWISQTDNSWNWAGTNKCIDLTDGNISDGNQLQLWTCVSGSSNQQFGNYQVPNDRSERQLLYAGDANPDDIVCMTATSNTDGARVVLGDCSDGSGRTSAFPDGTQWFTAPQDPLSGLIETFDGSKCLDLPDGDATNGKKLQIWSCVEGSLNQQFKILNPWPWAITWAGSGNKCLQIPNGNFTEGNEIEIWDCDSTKVSQHWF